jgi:hydroxymethylglutaryl-CoA synthase
MGRGITAYAAYLPRHRLQHHELGTALGTRGGRGARVLAAYDEDSTTMAVEAARHLVDSNAPPPTLCFATTTPPYLDKTNASAIHAALDLGHEGLAVDVAGSPRSATGALRLAAATDGLAILADMRTGLPASADERDGADGAVAFRFGPAEEAAAEIVGEASTTAEFLDRWRIPGDIASQQWEERFGLEIYLPLIKDAAARARAIAGVEGTDHVVVSSPHARAAATAAKELGGPPDDESTLTLGYAGAADAGLRLAAVLDRAEPGQTILLLNAADGCDATVLRVREPIARARCGVPVRAQAGAGRDVAYATYLTWRGLLHREPPRRPEPERPAGPPSARSEAWKFAFVGSACKECGQVHVPPRRVCVNCRSVDRMQRRALADKPGTVATYTVDRLAFSPSPPVIDAVVDFDGGGRCTLEITDAAPDEIDIGTRLELTFRRLYTVEGVHNYFWKARPIVVAADRTDG